MTPLPVGTRVRVVRRLVRGDKHLVGKLGTVVNIAGPSPSGLTHDVRLDGNKRTEHRAWFAPSELEPIAAEEARQ